MVCASRNDRYLAICVEVIFKIHQRAFVLITRQYKTNNKSKLSIPTIDHSNRMKLHI